MKKNILAYILLLIYLFSCVHTSLDNKSEINDMLINAAWTGDVEKVQQLIEQGADVNDRNKEGKTALNLAREEGNTDIVNLLLEAGAEE